MITPKHFKIRFLSGLAAIAVTVAATTTLPAPAAGDEPAMYPKGASGLTFQIDVLGPGAVADVPVIGPIVVDPFAGPALISVELAKDVLCMQNGVQTGATLELTDTNGRMTAFDGFADISYYPSAAPPVAGLTLKVQTDENPKCALVPPVAKTVVADGSPVECAASDTVFGDGFELGGAGVSGPNLQVDFRLIQHPNTSTGDPAVYDIHITNCGDATANTVAIRDLYPTSSALPPRLLAGGLWECVSGAACDGSFYINHVFSRLLPGGSRTIRATRSLDAGVAGEMIRVSAAAVSLTPTPDALPVFNSGSWEFEIRDNDAPTVTVTGAASNLAEDEATAPLPSVPLSGTLMIGAADSDGTITSVAVTSLDTSILTIDSVDDSNPANVLVNVATVADAFGTATLQVIATDNLGGTSPPVTFPVTVDPVNDQPTITVLGGFSGFDGMGSPVFVGPCTGGPPDGCADQKYASTVGTYTANFFDWVVQVTPGPANEIDENDPPMPQTATVSIGPPSNAGLFSNAPFLMKTGDTWFLGYTLTGASGTATVVITVDDGQMFNNPTTLSFDIVVDNAAPSVTAESFSIDENASGAVGTVSGTDPEMDPLQDWTITGGNTNVDLDTNPPFALNPVTGELTVNDADDLDFEDTASFTLTVTVSDGFNTSAPGNITVDLNDLNDNAPVVTSGLTFQIPENTDFCIPECRVTAADADTVGSLQGWVIESGNVSVDGDGNAPFTITDSTGDGLITVADLGDMDYEAATGFALMVSVGDGASTSAQELVTINLIDSNDNAPVIDPGQMFTIDENSPATTPVGSIAASDVDTVGSLQDWVITGGNDDLDMDTKPAFALDSASGELTVNDADDLDFEMQNQFSLSVRVSDGQLDSAVETVTVDIGDVAD